MSSESKGSSQRKMGYALVAFGVFWLLVRGDLFGAWTVPAMVGTGFLFAYRRTHNYGYVIPGCIVLGVAAGLMLEAITGFDSFFLLGLAGGFAAIDKLEPRPGRWPLYPATILAALGLMGILGSFIGSIFFALMLIIVGFYFLTRDGQSPELPAFEFKRDNASREPKPSVTSETVQAPTAADFLKTATETHEASAAKAAPAQPFIVAEPIAEHQSAQPPAAASEVIVAAVTQPTPTPQETVLPEPEMKAVEVTHIVDVEVTHIVEVTPTPTNVMPSPEPAVENTAPEPEVIAVTNPAPTAESVTLEKPTLIEPAPVVLDKAPEPPATEIMSQREDTPAPAAPEKPRDTEWLVRRLSVSPKAVEVDAPKPAAPTKPVNPTPLPEKERDTEWLVRRLSSTKTAS